MIYLINLFFVKSPSAVKGFSYLTNFLFFLFQGIKEGGGGGGGFSSPMDIFDMFFGGGMGGMGGGRSRGPRRTKNLMHQMSVSLEEMYNGATRKLALQKNVICSDCDGKFITYVWIRFQSQV